MSYPLNTFVLYRLTRSTVPGLHNIVSVYPMVPDLLRVRQMEDPGGLPYLAPMSPKGVFDRMAGVMANSTDEELALLKIRCLQLLTSSVVLRINEKVDRTEIMFFHESAYYAMTIAPLAMAPLAKKAEVDDEYSKDPKNWGSVGHGMDGSATSVPF